MCVYMCVCVITYIISILISVKTFKYHTAQDICNGINNFILLKDLTILNYFSQQVDI